MAGDRLGGHLGGHCNITHVDSGVLQGLYDQGHRSLVDVGCGPGGQVQAAINIGFDAMGIDGDPALHPEVPYIQHDYTTGPLQIGPVDVVWSCEFVEHVEEAFVANYMATFSAAKLIAMTYSQSRGGHHHVNLQPDSYWKNIVESYGFSFDQQLTDQLRSLSTMHRVFFRKFGLVFTRNT